MRSLNDVRIVTKLSTAFGTLAAVTIGISAIGYTHLASIQHVNYQTEHSYKVISALDGLARSMVNQETGLRGYLISGDPKFLDPFRSGQTAYKIALEAAKTLTADNGAQQGRLEAVNHSAETWSKEIAAKAIALVAEGNLDQARRFEASGAGKASMDALRAQIAETETAERDLLTARSAEQARSFSAAYLASFLGSIASVVIAALLAFLVFAMLTRPLARLVAVLQRMARGEIEAEIQEAQRGDEIGAVGRAVDGIKAMVAKKAAEEAEMKRIADAAAAAERRRTMVELADSFDRAVGGIVGRVSSSATELQATARAMSATASETSSQSTTVAAAAEEAASNVNTVAAAAEQLGSSVQEIGRQVDGSAHLAQRAVSDADQTSARVQELSAAVSRIGDVVGLISTIAGQTNLLALNATIEAARAGAAGKGFAVVAAEVKALAEQTAKATQEISGQIAQIQASTGQAVTAIGGITERIREISGVATSIAAAVEQQGAATQEIVRNVAQAALGAGEVTSNISGVAGAAEETGAAASQVLGAAAELSRQSHALTAEVGRADSRACRRERPTRGRRSKGRLCEARFAEMRSGAVAHRHESLQVAGVGVPGRRLQGRARLTADPFRFGRRTLPGRRPMPTAVRQEKQAVDPQSFTVDLRQGGNRRPTGSVQFGEKRPLGRDRCGGTGAGDGCQEVADRGVIRAALDPQRSLGDRRKHVLNGEDAAGHALQSEPLESRQGEQRRVALAGLKLAHPGVGVAAQRDHAQIGPAHQHLRTATQRRRSDPGTGRQPRKPVRMRRQERVPRVVALEDAGDGEPLREPCLDVLHRMDGDIDFAGEQRLLKLFGEEALSADLREGPIEDLVGDRGDNHQLGLQSWIGRHDPVAHHAGLRERHRRAAGADAQRAVQHLVPDRFVGHDTAL